MFAVTVKSVYNHTINVLVNTSKETKLKCLEDLSLVFSRHSTAHVDT